MQLDESYRLPAKISLFQQLIFRDPHLFLSYSYSGGIEEGAIERENLGFYPSFRNNFSLFLESLPASPDESVLRGGITSCKFGKAKLGHKWRKKVGRETPS